MNRKLHNSMLAFSATGLMLVFALLAASPVQHGQDVPAQVALSASADPAAVAGLDAAVHARAEAAKARALDIEARAHALEAQLDQSASLGDTIASAVGFAAAMSTEAALGAAFEAGNDETDQEREQAREQRRHARQVRGALAVPYFSFAQGLRRGSRS